MKRKLIPLNLQFFAEDQNNDLDDNVNDKPQDEEDNNDEDEGGDDDQDDKKTFTQKEVKNIASKEKKQGRKALLKKLGFESEEEAVKAFDLLKTLTGAMKTDKEKLDDEEKKKDKSNKRAELAEAKLSCYEAGVNKDSIDDVMSIAMNKVDDENSLEDVLEEMKKNKRYAMFFDNSSDVDEEDNNDDVPKNKSKGTGNKPKHSKKKQDNESMGARLAKQQQNAQHKKSNYFD